MGLCPLGSANAGVPIIMPLGHFLLISLVRYPNFSMYFLFRFSSKLLGVTSVSTWNPYIDFSFVTDASLTLLMRAANALEGGRSNALHLSCFHLLYGRVKLQTLLTQHLSEFKIWFTPFFSIWPRSFATKNIKFTWGRVINLRVRLLEGRWEGSLSLSSSDLIFLFWASNSASLVRILYNLALVRATAFLFKILKYFVCIMLMGCFRLWNRIRIWIMNVSLKWKSLNCRLINLYLERNFGYFFSI